MHSAVTHLRPGRVITRPAVLSEEVVLPGRRQNLPLNWDQSQAATDSALKAAHHQLIVLAQRSSVPAAQICLGVLVDIELDNAGQDKPWRYLKVYGRALVSLSKVTSSSTWKATGRIQPPFSDPVSAKDRVYIIDALRIASAGEEGTSTRIPQPRAAFTNLSDFELIALAATRLGLSAERDYQLLLCQSSGQQAQVLRHAVRDYRALHPVHRRRKSSRKPRQTTSEFSGLPDHIRTVMEAAEAGDSWGHTSDAAKQMILGFRWTPPPSHPISLPTASARLDTDLHGMTEVKEAVLDLLASWEWARRHGSTTNLHGKTLCLLGPPGVGKTTIAWSIAEAMGRQLIDMPMGGVDDVFLAGADQAYNRARPGEIARRIHHSGCHPSELVFLLDEIDKVDKDGHRSPLPLLLALLDPLQQSRWQDHFLDAFRLDLSGAVFICTANELDDLPAPLLDRLQPMTLRGYTKAEQAEIATTHLWPRLLTKNQVTNQVQLLPESIHALVYESPPSPGMRQLVSQLDGLLKRALRQVLDTDSTVVINPEMTRSWARLSVSASAAIGFRPAPKA